VGSLCHGDAACAEQNLYHNHAFVAGRGGHRAFGRDCKQINARTNKQQEQLLLLSLLLFKFSPSLLLQLMRVAKRVTKKVAAEAEAEAEAAAEAA
jgi:hypothetical protein